MKATFALVCLFACGTLGALDFGATVENLSLVEGSSSASLVQENTASAWVTLVTPESSFRAEGFFEYQSGNEPGQTVEVPYRFDFKELSYQSQWSGWFGAQSLTTIKAGRYEFEYPSSRILNATLDGLTVREALGNLDLSLAGGYTGLAAEEDANIFLSPADVSDYQGTSNVPYFAPKRVFAQASAHWLELLPRHDLTLVLVGQYDLRSADPIDTGYAELFAEGRPASWFRWQTYGIGELWSDAVGVPSLAGGARGQASFPEWSDLLALASVEWSSGTNGTLRAFTGIDQRQVAQISPEVFSNTLTGEVAFNLRVWEEVHLGAQGYTIFRTSNQVPADTLFPTSATAWFLGNEALVSLDYAYAGLFTGELKFGAFLPNTAGDAYGAGALPRWLGSVDLKVLL